MSTQTYIPNTYSIYINKNNNIDRIWRISSIISPQRKAIMPLRFTGNEINEETLEVLRIGTVVRQLGGGW